MKYRFLFTIIFLLFARLIVVCQQQKIFHSEHIPKPDTILVYTPETYNSNQDSFPLIYMLHGWAGDYKQWGEIIDLQEYADKYNFIIVCPDGIYDSWYINSPVNSKIQYVDFFFSDLHPFISENYCIDTTKIFITGLSMGGYGAMHLFLQKPEMFYSAGSTSGTVNLECSSQVDNSLSEILGDYSSNKETFAKYSVTNQIDKLENTTKQIIFDCGTEDHLYMANKQLREKCDKLKIRATYICQPGRHNYSYWKKSIPYHFIFFKSFCN